LDDIITRGDIFWCHQGIRRVVEYRHPDGRVYPVPPLAAGVDGAYEPPIIDGRPYKADGTPADVCAGWWARFERRDEVRA
jgi:MoaA/NifB/PqqE/SkfB family radical SAM enzyme